MGEPVTKERLLRYVYLQMEYYNNIDRLARLENSTQLPAMQQSDGSQRSLLKASRMERAADRKMDQEKKIRAKIARLVEEMDEIEDAVDNLPDPMQKEVLRLRYLDCDESEDYESCKHMKWGDVAKKIYGSDDEKYKMAIWRIHGHALQELLEQERKENEQA